MSDDIVDRLGVMADAIGGAHMPDDYLVALLTDAADEFERLRAVVLDLVSSPSLRERQAIAATVLGIPAVRALGDD